jgi:hypothetical protein
MKSSRLSRRSLIKGAGLTLVGVLAMAGKEVAFERCIL